MKRRDFLTKTAISAIGAGTILNTGIEQAIGKVPENNETTSLNLSGEGDVLDLANPEVMEYAYKARSGVTIGGIGAGGAEIRKDGIFYNWSIFNNNPRGSGKFLENAPHLDSNRYTRSLYPYEPSNFLFFKLRYQVEGEEPKIKILQIDQGYQVANISMHIYENPWISGVQRIEYKARFPFAQLKFTDPDMPVAVGLEIFSPFIPNDLKNSSLPVMFFDFKIISLIDKPVDVTIVSVQRNLVGYDVEDKYYTVELYRKTGYHAYQASVAGMDSKNYNFGTMGIASLSDSSSYYLGWEHRHPYYELLLRNKDLINKDDTEGRNNYKTKLGTKKGFSNLLNSIGLYKNLVPKETLTHSFIMTWNFPNMHDESNKEIVGNYYSNFFADSKEVMEYAIINSKMLKDQSRKFLENYYDSTAPKFVLDQVNTHLSTFITSGLLSKNKEFGIIEGITPHQSWGPVGTTDVNLYGGTLVCSLFPELQMSTMRVHKALQHPGGEIRHSFMKGFSQYIRDVAGVSDRLDLPSQYVNMVMRDFFWTNDMDYLREFWPSIKKALDYVIEKRDLNGDQQPDMTGIMCSYDNFPMYGIASYIHSQWLCALASAAEGAEFMKDKIAIKKYAAIFEKGRKLAEEKLWNGKYYRLYNSDLKTMEIKDGAGKTVTKDISGTDEGCLTDQIIGQWAAHWSDLPQIFNPEHVKQALKSILEMSYKPDFGLRNCSWPGDKLWHEIPDDIWVDQANTCWSGVELSFASFLLYEGFYDEALKVIKTVDDRYMKYGRYWDHQEFGGHYFRAMGAWAIINALVGLKIKNEVYTFAPNAQGKDFKLFFTFPGGTASLSFKDKNLSINVLSGEWKCKKIKIKGLEFLNEKVVCSMGKNPISKSKKMGLNIFEFDFGKTLIMKTGEGLEIV